MKAAVVVEPGKAPVYGDFKDPVQETGEVQVTVSAASLSNVVKSRASGTHYSSSGDLPFVVGIDGVGVSLPDDLDDVTAAAIANPGMSAWAAFKERARLTAGETVLVNGATGTAGRLAVQIAKYMGARKVVATGRNVGALNALSVLGADVTIPLGEAGDGFEDALREQFGGDGIDVVLDYLWGQSAERVIAAGAKAGKDAVPIRFVQIGAVSAPKITLPSAALRSSAITLMGCGIGSIAVDRLVKSIDELLQATVSGGFKIATKIFPLSEVEHVWASAGSMPRIVFRTPDFQLAGVA